MKKESPKAPRPGIVAAPAALTEFPIGMFLAWCECGWPDDAHEMEILVAGGR